MANADTPRGFTPVNSDGSGTFSGKVQRFYKSATAGILGIGDEVIRATNSTDPEGGPEIVKATVGAAITGVIVGYEPNRANLTQLHLASADTRYVYVSTDPDQLYEAQDTTGGTALVVTQIGEHIDSITAVDADTSTGRSKAELDNAAVATGNTWRIEGLVQRADNVVGEHAMWLVKANLHTERNASATSLTEI